MAQEMYKHEALMHLVWAVAKADSPVGDVWSTDISNAEKAYFDKIQKAEGITLDFHDFIEKRKSIRERFNSEQIIEEALKATNGCSREWRTKVYGYMWRMALKSWEGEFYSDGSESKCSDKEYAILKKAKAYFQITEEEDDLKFNLTKVS